MVSVYARAERSKLLCVAIVRPQKLAQCGYAVMPFGEIAITAQSRKDYSPIELLAFW